MEAYPIDINGNKSPNGAGIRVKTETGNIEVYPIDINGNKSPNGAGIRVTGEENIAASSLGDLEELLQLHRDLTK